MQAYKLRVCLLRVDELVHGQLENSMSSQREIEPLECVLIGEGLLEKNSYHTDPAVSKSKN